MIVNLLLSRFPRLSIGGFQITSAASTRYNCIAWAATRDDCVWWPHPDAFWPSAAPLEETLQAFEAAFTTLGYSRCDSDSLEPEYEKVAIYVDAAGKPKHAARQLPSGRWTSKMGPQVDIEHVAPDALIGNDYGTPVLFMRRQTQHRQ